MRVEDRGLGEHQVLKQQSDSDKTAHKVLESKCTLCSRVSSVWVSEWLCAGCRMCLPLFGIH